MWLAPVATFAVAPNFEAFARRATGHWQGARFTWTHSEEPDATALGVSEGYVTVPVQSSSQMEEVMRSCGGAVQGLREIREAQESQSVFLNRADDGFVFFEDGTWTRAPSQLKVDGSTDMLCAPEAFGLSVSISHLDLRQRVDLAFIDKRLVIADVRIESELTKESAESIQMLLNERRMQVVKEAYAWSDGGVLCTLTGRPPAGTPWSAVRTRWTKDTSSVAGGQPLVPQASAELVHLPGGLWVGLSPGGSTLAEETLSVSIGSICAQSEEVKELVHTYAKSNLGLQSVQLREIKAAPR